MKLLEASEKIERWEDGERKDIARELISKLDNAYLKICRLESRCEDCMYSTMISFDSGDKQKAKDAIQLLTRIIDE